MDGHLDDEKAAVKPNFRYALVFKNEKIVESLKKLNSMKKVQVEVRVRGKHYKNTFYSAQVIGYTTDPLKLSLMNSLLSIKSKTSILIVCRQT